MKEKGAKQGRAHFLRRAQVWLLAAVAALAYAGLWSVGSSGGARLPHTSPSSHIEKSAKPDCRRVACIALTFDDGPEPKNTARILRTLEQEHVHATFFVIGSRVGANAQLIERMHKNGMEVGNHSWSHQDMTRLKPRQIRAQITRTQIAVERAGAPAPLLFRPPYGAANTKLRKNIPLAFMFWNEDPRDWAARKPSQVVRAVEKAARPGGIVDLHDIYPVTAAALPKIIRDLKAKRYHFVTASQLMRLRPRQTGDFYGYK